MSLKKKELTEKNGFTIEFSVEKDAYEKAEDEAYRKAVKQMNVPGFRKGKAPKHVIQKLYGKGVFFEDAINACIPDAYTAAIEEAGLEVVGNPSFDIVSADDDIILKAVGFVKPEAKVDGYKDIRVKKNTKEVTDADVQEEIDRVRERNARNIDVTDRPAQNGDTVNIDYEGFADGIAFDGGKAEGHDLKLGSGAFIPGFEDQIVGKNIGDSFDVTVTFPADYHAKDLAGKRAVFKTKLNSIKTAELPAADDEFAKDVSEFDTLDEYKADIKAKIQERNAKEAEAEFERAVTDALVEKLVCDIPEPMFQQETENYLRDYDTRLRMNGLDLKTYFKYTGLDLDKLREQLRPQAEKQVKTRLALEAVAALENVKIPDEKVEEEYGKIASNYNMQLDEVKKMVSADDIRKDLEVAEALEILKKIASEQ